MPATKARTLSPASEAWGLLQELGAAIKQSYMSLAEELELSPPQILALRALDPDRPVPMNELAGACHLDSSTVTGIVDRLEDRGLVERRSAEHDRRVKLVAATAEGARLHRRISRLLEEAPGPIERLSRKDQIALRDVLRRALKQA